MGGVNSMADSPYSLLLVLYHGSIPGVPNSGRIFERKRRKEWQEILDSFSKMLYDKEQSLPDATSVSGMAALVGEIAVPCTCNQLQQG